jgi:hypothetical protein
VPTERILVLANSRKIGGRCVAGLSLERFDWVRPVSPEGEGELSDEACDVGGRLPRLLDVVTFEHCGPEGDPAQPENVVLTDAPWTSEGRADRALAHRMLRRAAQGAPPLLGNNGKAVPEHVAADGIDASLALIAPSRLRFGHGPAVDREQRKPRALFDWGGQAWNLPVTDFIVGPRVIERPAGLYAWEELGLPAASALFLTMSLSLPYEGWCYKLVAAVVPMP